MLIKRTERPAAARAVSRLLPARPIAVLTAAAFLRRSGLVAGGLGALGALPLGAVRRAEAGPPPPTGAQGDDPQERLHPLRGRLHRHRRSRQRRVDRPGAELGQPDQPRLALRQGRLGARTRVGRAAAQISAEARRRQMDPHLLGPGGRRDRRQAIGDPREIGPGFGLLAGLGQIHQRGRLPVPQARRLLGHQQHRSSGADLPFDDGHRRRQYLGLRCDDQQLQRYPQFEDADHLGRQSGRSASGVAAAPARRCRAQQGECRRRRSATDAHGRARDRICAAAAGHRHSGALRHDVAHPAKRLGGQGVHRAARLRFRGRPQEIEKWTPEEVERVSGVPAEQLKRVARMFATEKPATLDLVHGPDPAHRRHRQCAGELHRAAC